jgi:hypothetical protein
MLGALGLKLIVAEDHEAMEKIKPRWEARAACTSSPRCTDECPLSGVKRTFRLSGKMSAP